MQTIFLFIKNRGDKRKNMDIEEYKKILEYKVLGISQEK
jgi:hypothetical protein